jgi:Holliday junction DNA helicase RuvA
MSVREDAIQLYGFATQEEYELFLQLISVSGIGPKVALGMLSHITVEALCQAIRQKQTSVLTRLPGIGKKSADRLVLELKDKVAGFGDAVADEELASSSIDAAGDDMLAEAQAALLSLGYNQAEITPVLNKAGKGKNTSEIIKLALKELSKL